ncbi:MAG: type II secretion system minor pseudopilin GspI [Betaproteobacteria bacterium]|nr:type II secretion system minor pseudopilin GspI [Betaproteobacteria bacterium]
MASNERTGHRGFTLIEVIVALAILAIAMAAVSRATLSLVDAAGEARTRLLAGFVAQNRLALHEAMRDWPAVGTVNGTQAEAGRAFEWEEAVTKTPNRSFERIDIRVYAAGDPHYAVAHVVGYLAHVSDAGPAVASP